MDAAVHVMVDELELLARIGLAKRRGETRGLPGQLAVLHRVPTSVEPRVVDLEGHGTENVGTAGEGAFVGCGARPE